MDKMMDGSGIKEAYKKVMNCKYGYHLAYEKASNLAYAVNALGLKRILMKLSEQSYCDYLCLRDKAISIHECEIVPDIKYAESLLMKIEEIQVSPLAIDGKIYVDRVKKLMKMIKEYLKMDIDIIMDAIAPIQYDYPVDYMKIMKMLKCNYHWLKKIQKMEMLYDKGMWDNPAMIALHQKKIHDKVKKNKY